MAGPHIVHFNSNGHPLHIIGHLPIFVVHCTVVLDSDGEVWFVLLWATLIFVSSSSSQPYSPETPLYSGAVQMACIASTVTVAAASTVAVASAAMASDAAATMASDAAAMTVADAAATTVADEAATTVAVAQVRTSNKLEGALFRH